METSNMEMTMACTTNITILPGLMDRGPQNKENTSGITIYTNKNFRLYFFTNNFQDHKNRASFVSVQEGRVHYYSILQL